MAVACPLCKTSLVNPREACPVCGTKLAADALAYGERDTKPPPANYEEQHTKTAPPPANYGAHVKGDGAADKSPPAKPAGGIVAKPIVAKPIVAKPIAAKPIPTPAAANAAVAKPASEPAIPPAPRAPNNVGMPGLTDHGRMVELGDTTSVELEVDKIDRPPSVPDDSFALQKGPDNRVVAAVAPMAKPAPAGVDPAEARLLAKFGPVPDSWLQKIGYAQRVRGRIAELNKGAREADDKAQTLRAQLDRALMGVAQRGIAAAEEMPRTARGGYHRTLEKLQEREKQLRAVDEATFAKTQTHREAQEQLAKKADDLEDQLEAAREEEQRVTGNPRETARVRGQIAELERSVRELAQQRDAIEKEIKALSTQTDPKIIKAREDYQASAINFAQFVIDDRASFGEAFDAAREKINKLRETTDKAEREAMLYRAAARAYDEAAFAAGTRILAAAVGTGILAALMIVYLVAR